MGPLIETGEARSDAHGAAGFGAAAINPYLLGVVGAGPTDAAVRTNEPKALGNYIQALNKGLDDHVR